MKTLNPTGMKILKIFHLLFAIMWIGGVMALICVELFGHPTDPQMTMMSATDQLIIDLWFLIPGGIGIVITGILYGVFTKWGFWKHTWLKVKWVLTVLLVLIGAGYMGVLIKKNIVVVQSALDNSGNMSQYWDNVLNISVSGIIQIIGFICIIIISVFKPWKK